MKKNNRKSRSKLPPDGVTLNTILNFVAFVHLVGHFSLGFVVNLFLKFQKSLYKVTSHRGKFEIANKMNPVSTL